MAQNYIVIRGNGSMNENNYVVQSNALVLQKSTLTLVEQKILLTIISMINPTAEKFETTYRLRVSDFKKLMGLKGKGIYQDIHNANLRLRKHSFTIIDGKRKIATGWINNAITDEETGEIVYELDRHLEPLLIQLHKYTKYRLKHILQMKSAYSIRVYEVLIQAINFTDSRKFTIETLRQLLGVEDSYSRYRDFRRYAIDKAIAEINKYSDLEVSYKETRNSQQVVTHVTFFFKKKEGFEERIEALTEVAAAIEETEGDISSYASPDDEDYPF